MINPYKEIFANGKTKEEKHIYPNFVNFKEILKVMNVELSFSNALYRDIRSFERKFKNLVFSELCNIYVSNQDVYCIQYNVEIYNFLIEYSKLKDKELTCEELNKSLPIPLLCQNIFKVLTKKGYTYSSYQINNRLDLLNKIYSNGCGHTIDGNPEEKNNHLLAHYINHNQIVPLWCIPNVLTLGEVTMLFSMLPIESQNKICIALGGPAIIVKNGKYEYKRLTQFTGRIEYIRNIRNIINHYEPLLPTFVSCIQNKAKLLKDSIIISSLSILNHDFNYRVNNIQNYSSNLNIEFDVTTFNIPKIRLLEMMDAYIKQSA